MPQKPETLFRRRVQVKLDKLPNSWWESIQQKAIQGTPDILGCLKGLFIGLELKATAKSAITPLQVHKLSLIKAAGGYSAIVHPDNLDAVINDLEQIAATGIRRTTC